MTFIGNLGKIVNNAQNKEAANEFVVMTMKDNMVHNYFFSCDNFWDSRNCLSKVTIGFAKDNHEQINYWTNYDDIVYVYMGNQVSKDIKINQINYTIGKKENPFFVGRVYDIYEYSDQMLVQLHNIGERFKQKIPKEFREAYINNQNVRDTFQAICEFIGVKYICPPANIQQTGSQKPDGSVNDPSQKKKAETSTKEDIKSKSDSKEDGNSGTEQTTTNTQTIDNGYSQINFDANGAITFNGAVIEESMNSEEKLLQITDTTYDDFLKEGKDVIKDVKDFLNGEIFEEIHPFYLDYNAITIQPKSSTTTTPKKVDDDPNTPQDTKKSMKKTKAFKENLESASTASTTVQQRQLVNPVAISTATNVQSPANIQKSLK